LELWLGDCSVKPNNGNVIPSNEAFKWNVLPLEMGLTLGPLFEFYLKESCNFLLDWAMIWSEGNDPC
jgi:hypothetical protein